MRSILSERNVVVLLFILVLITFSFAQQDSRKMNKFYSGYQKESSARLMGELTSGKQNPARVIVSRNP